MIAPEYRAARRTLLDALDALVEHRAALVLVGAQAIYLRVGEADLGLPSAPTTTDADLAINPELLAREPRIAMALSEAGFAALGQPGSWTNEAGVAVDVMVCPHHSGRSGKNVRGARLGNLGHPEKETARITAGLEPALVDHSPMTLRALDLTDERSVTINIAGAAAMVSAKLTKINERLDAASAGRAHRVRDKDVTDVFRLLSGTDIGELLAGFERHLVCPEATAASKKAMTFLEADMKIPGRSRLRLVFSAATEEDRVLLRRWDALTSEITANTRSLWF